jgi:hypothetical protein
VSGIDGFPLRVSHNICRIVNRCGLILFLRFELLDE